jgi:hypothetical protein
MKLIKVGGVPGTAYYRLEGELPVRCRGQIALRTPVLVQAVGVGQDERSQLVGDVSHQGVVGALDRAATTYHPAPSWGRGLLCTQALVHWRDVDPAARELAAACGTDKSALLPPMACLELGRITVRVQTIGQWPGLWHL